MFLLLALFAFFTANPIFRFSGPGSTLAFDKSTAKLTVQTPLSIEDGTIKLSSTTTGTNLVQSGGAISLSNSSILIDTNQIDLNAANYGYDGSGNPQITLSNGQLLSVSGGTNVYPNVLIAASSTATIVGTPLFSYPITLTNSTSTLNLGLEHKLNQNISLNGGKIVLLDKLELADGVQLTGTGTLDLSNKSLSISGASSAWSSPLTFWRGKDISIESPLSLTNTWSFMTPSGSPTDNVSVINGNGNVLTFGGSGQICVGDANGGHTLYISDLTLSGLALSVTTQQPSPFVPVLGLTQSQFNSFYPTSAYGNTLYENGFVAVSGSNTNGTTMAQTYDSNEGQQVAIYDGPPGSPISNPILYYSDLESPNAYIYSHSLGTAGRTLVDMNSITLDVGADGLLVAQTSDGANWYIYKYPGGVKTQISPTTNFYTVYLAVGDANNIYYARAYSGGTTIYKYSGSGTTWNTFATGFGQIHRMQASQDGKVWVMDSSNNSFYIVEQGQTPSTATNISFNDINGNSIVSGTMSFSLKGSFSGNSIKAVINKGPFMYTSSDGINFSLAQPTFGVLTFRCASIGANGVLVLVSQGTPHLTVFAKIPTPPTTTRTVDTFCLYGSTNSANRGKVVLSNCSLVLSASYTHSTGEIRIAGDNCILTTGGNKTFNITSSNAPLIVDSVALIYETLGGNNISPFASSTNAPTLTNGGTIRSAIPAFVSSDTSFDANLTPTPSALGHNYSFYTPYTFGYNTYSNRIVVSNSASLGTPKSITIDGGNYTWNFPTNSGACIVIDHDTTVTLRNVVLKNFALDKVAFNSTANFSTSTPTTANGSGATLIFGQNCIVELAKNQTLTGDGSVSTATNIFNFAPGAGNTALISGRNLNLNLQNNQCFKLSSAGTLIIENTNINTSGSATALACTNSSGTIELKDCNLKINSVGLNYTTGNLAVSGWTKVLSATNAGSPAVLCFYQQPSGSGILTIKDGATLEIGRNCTLSYACPSKTQLVMASNASTILLNKGTLDAYTKYLGNSNFGTGCRFSQGNIIIDNLVPFIASTTAGEEIEISANANFEVLADAYLQVTGNIKYIP